MASTPLRLRRIAIPVLAAFVLVGSVTIFANAASSAGTFTVTTMTACVKAGTTSLITLKVTNGTGSAMGSIFVDGAKSNFSNITLATDTPPAGWTLHREDAYTGQSDRSDLDGVYLTANSAANALAAGASMTFSFTAKIGTSTGSKILNDSAWTGTTPRSGKAFTSTSNSVNIASSCVGPAFQLKFSTQPASTTSGASLSPGLKVQVLDSNNNLVTTATNPITISLVQPQNWGATLTQPTPPPTVAGVATFTGLSVDKVGTYQLQATATGLGPDTTNQFSITAGQPAKVVYVAPDPTDLASGSSRNFMVNVVDAAGNLTNYSGPIDFTQSGGAGTVIGLPDHVTASGGSATSDDITGLGTGPVSVQAGGGSLGTSTTSFNVVTGPGPKIVFVDPDTLDLPSATDRTFTLNVLNQSDHLIAYNGSITVSQQGGTGTVSGLGDVVASGGVAQVTVTGGKVVGVTLQASATGMASDSTTFDVVPGTPDHIVLDSPNSTDLPSGYSRNFMVDVLDANDNLVTNSTAQIDFASTGGTGTVSGVPQTVTAVSGVATSNDITGVLNGSVTIQASAHAPSNITGTPSVTFNVVSGDASTLTFTQQPKDTKLGDPIPDVKVLVKDAQSQVVPNTNVTISIANNGGVDDQGNPSPGTLTCPLGCTVPTNGSGVATFSNLSIDTHGDGYTLQATSGTATPATSSPFSIYDTKVCPGGTTGPTDFTSVAFTGAGSLDISGLTADQCSGVSVTNSVDQNGTQTWVIDAAKPSPTTKFTGYATWTWELPGTDPVPLTQVSWKVNVGGTLVSTQFINMPRCVASAVTDPLPTPGSDAYFQLFPLVSVPGFTDPIPAGVCFYAESLVTAGGTYLDTQQIAINEDPAGRKG